MAHTEQEYGDRNGERDENIPQNASVAICVGQFVDSDQLRVILYH